MNAVDTNVLLYVHDPRDVTKQAIAANLLQSVKERASFRRLSSSDVGKRHHESAGVSGGAGLRAYHLEAL